MAEYSKEAEIIKAIEIFSTEYFKNNDVKNIPHEHKYTLGEFVKNAILEMDKVFCTGWKSTAPEDELRYYERASGLLMFIQHKLNMMNDMCIITNKNKAVFDILTRKIDKQLLGMANSMRSKIKLAKRRSVRDAESAGGELDN